MQTSSPTPAPFPTESGDSAEDATRFADSVARAVPDILYVYDLEAQSNIYCNREVASVLGYSAEEIRALKEKLFTTLLHPDDIKTVAEGQARLRDAADGEVVEIVYRMRHRDGSYRWLHSRDTVFARSRNDNGAVTQILGIARDITAERHAQEQLAESAERYRSLISVLADWVWEVGPDAAYTYVSPQAMEFLGYEPEDLLGKVPFQFMPPEDAARVGAAFTEVAAALKPFKGLEHAMVGRNGHAIQVEVSGTPVFDAETGEWRGYRGVNRDITARRQWEAEREALLQEARLRADHDPLTGLLNRAAFYRQLEEALQASSIFSVILFDLDNFKFFNDAYGHQAGDEVLMSVAAALRSCCREGDALARLGGDEFAVLFSGLDQEAARARLDAMKSAVDQVGYRPRLTQIHGKVEAVPDEEGARVPLGLSGGVATAPADAVTVDTLLAVADERLYRDKTSGRPSWSIALRAELGARLPGFAALDALVAGVDAKDRYTLRHSEDVLINAALIGKEIGLSVADQEALEVTALLHDVGKVGVPDRLLRLPGPLSLAEYESVKLHAALGSALVTSAAPDLDRRMPAVVPAIRHHHERWEGTGYPDGLRGEDIPLLARLLAVADAFSAITTDRPYRRGRTSAEALQCLQEGAGQQWDPACVAAFSRVLRERLSDSAG